ncbi:MAG: copper homeostasis protein CutC [Bacteroidetes bacterium]|nr:copper homeostasis protein CutC [Bacteroidota bacterium]
MKPDYLVEVCVANLASAIAAQKGGAQRIELCDNLYEGGTTPSYSMIRKVRQLLRIDVNVMIRPRGGDFLYTDAEFDIMLEDIRICRELKADGVVFGILLSDGTIDVDRCRILVEQAWPMTTTFHRAFDLTPDPYQALESIIALEMDRILTAGQQNKVPEGVALISKLIDTAGDRIIIMPGSGINTQNIREIRDITNTKEFHLTGRKILESKMKYRKEGIHMGGIPDIPEYDVLATDASIIRDIVKLLQS